MKSSFFDKVYEVVNCIPKQKVATYGQIAVILGVPRAARQVGFALSRLTATSKVPWWRVVNASGMISIENLALPKSEQVRCLQAESIEVILKDGNYWVDLKRHLWTGVYSGPARRSSAKGGA